jgi:quinol monooxygenase YgiN
MQIDRRIFLQSLGVVTVAPYLAHSQESNDMYGIIAKLIIAPGKRDEMIAILRDSAANMPGCLSYVVAKDAADENTLWITEVWDNAASHDASLSLPAVKNAIPQAKGLIAGFEKVAATTPVWGAGLPIPAR